LTAQPGPTAFGASDHMRGAKALLSHLYIPSRHCECRRHAAISYQDDDAIFLDCRALRARNDEISYYDAHHDDVDVIVMAFASVILDELISRDNSARNGDHTYFFSSPA
jgi:hypothetical protein